MSKKTRVGIIGLGGISVKRHIPAFNKHPNAEIVAVCDVIPETTASIAQDLGVKYSFTNYDDLIGMDEIDVVDICTPNFAHLDPAVKALNAGKHVFLEKPIARNAEEGKLILDAAKNSGSKLMIGYCFRWNPNVRVLKRFIDAGEMGEIYYARAHALRRRGIPSWGVFTQKDKQGGGPLIDIGCHVLDLTIWLMGHPKPVSVSGLAQTKFGNKPGLVGSYGAWDHENYTVEDFAVALIRFANGASLTIESSFAANIEKDVFNSVILGTEGGCQLNPLKMFREENQTLIDITPAAQPEVQWHEAEIFEFLDSVRNDRPVPVSGEEGLVVTQIIDAIYKSAEENREVLI